MTVELKINSNEAVLLFDTQTECSTLNEADDILSLIKKNAVKTVYAVTKQENFSSLQAAEIYAWLSMAKKNNFYLDISRLPKNLKELLTLTETSANTPPEDNLADKEWLVELGTKSYEIYKSVKNTLSFIRQTFLSLVHFFSGTTIFRSKDFWFIFADCSYKAVGIISLVSFLVGLILAFVGALQLKTFGAGIYVASMVSLGMTRIMAAIMVGIIMAGRTGSSYAATLGTMQVNEEIDALKTLGVKITDYLVAPRLVSLVATIPFLTLLADVLGILGGAVVGVSFLDLSSSSYFDYSIKALSLKNILVGLLHSFIYGIIISICGCYEGLNAGRDADSVGKATTNAVVTSLVWMIIATGILTVILEVLGI